MQRGHSRKWTRNTTEISSCWCIGRQLSYLSQKNLATESLHTVKIFRSDQRCKMLCANTHTLLNLPCCHTLGHVQGYTSKCLDKVKTNCRAFPTSKRKPRRPKRYIVGRLCLQIKRTFCMGHITWHPDLVGLTHSLEQPLEWRNDKLDWKGQPSFRRPPYVVSAVSSIVLLYSYNYIRRRLNPDNEDITGVKACDTSGRLWTWKDRCSPGRIRLPIKGYFRLLCLKSGPSRLMPI